MFYENFCGDSRPGVLFLNVQGDFSPDGFPSRHTGYIAPCCNDQVRFYRCEQTFDYPDGFKKPKRKFQVILNSPFVPRAGKPFYRNGVFFVKKSLFFPVCLNAQS